MAERTIEIEGSEGERQREAAFRLLHKFHTETGCGERTGDHWAECEALADAFGYDSYGDWVGRRFEAYLAD